MNFKQIVKKACEQNIDCDADGKVDGYEFAAEQIIRDLARSRFRIVNRAGKTVDIKEIRK